MNKEGFELILERLIGSAIERTYDVEVDEISSIRYANFNEDDVDFYVDCILYNGWACLKRKYIVYGYISDKVVVTSRTPRYDN